MKKISEFENEAAIELLADLITPASAILADKDMKKAMMQGKTKAEIGAVAMKNHSSEVVEILARLNEVEVKDFHCNVISIMKDLMDMMNDEVLVDFFQSQAKEAQTASSGQLAENTKAKKK